ncbi:E3 ubiquitin-protein ligase TRIM71-like [Oculina patagonica]
MATAQADGEETSALFQRLRKEAKCPLCSKTIEEPKVLRCQHSFCLNCLNKRTMEAEKDNKSHINCVVCNSSVKIPSEGTFEDLPTSIYLNRLGEIVSLGVAKSGTQICWNCNQSKTLLSYCFQCEHFLCEICQAEHKRHRSTRAHRIVLIHDLKEQDFDDIINSTVMCRQKDHDKQPVKYFCHDCNVCICNLCVDELHNTHNIEGVDRASEQSKLNIMGTVQQLKTRLAECEAEVKRREKGAATVKLDISEIQKELHKNVEEAILELKLYEQEALAKLDNLGNEQQIAFAAQQEKQASRLAVLTDFVTYGEKVLQSNLPLPVLQEHITFAEQYQQAITDVKDDDSFKPPEINFVPNEDFAEIIKKFGLGEIVVRSTDPSKSFLDDDFLTEAKVGNEICFTIVTRDQKGEGFYCADNKVIVSVYSPTGKQLQREIEDSKDGRYKVTYTPQICGQHIIVVGINGEPLAGSPWTVEVTSSK